MRWRIFLPFAAVQWNKTISLDKLFSLPLLSRSRKIVYVHSILLKTKNLTLNQYEILSVNLVEALPAASVTNGAVNATHAFVKFLIIRQLPAGLNFQKRYILKFAVHALAIRGELFPATYEHPFYDNHLRWN